ncbi:hypothetical protein HK098_001410, partial [Nowakowskiella sp. JEL0407]
MEISYNKRESEILMRSYSMYFNSRKETTSYIDERWIMEFLNAQKQAIQLIISASILDPSVSFTGAVQRLTRGGGSRRSLDSLSQAPSSVGGPFQFRSGGRHLDLLLDENIRRYRQLITDIIHEIDRTSGIIQGTEEVATLLEFQEHLETMHEICSDVFPRLWLENVRSFASCTPLKKWFKNLLHRLNYIKEWYFLRHGDHIQPVRGFVIYDISCMFSPKALIYAILQDGAAKLKEPIENISLDSLILSGRQATPPERGLYISGLNLFGATWNFGNNVLKDCKPNEFYSPVPCIWLQPVARTKLPAIAYTASQLAKSQPKQTSIKR